MDALDDLGFIVMAETRWYASSDEAVELHDEEMGNRTAYLHQKGDVEVVALRSLALLVSAVAASSNQINTLQRKRKICRVIVFSIV